MRWPIRVWALSMMAVGLYRCWIEYGATGALIAAAVGAYVGIAAHRVLRSLGG